MCRDALKVFLSQIERFSSLVGRRGVSLLALKTGGICADDPKQEPIGFSVFFQSSSVCLMMNEIREFDRYAKYGL
jgi:hypothetical protein